MYCPHCRRDADDADIKRILVGKSELLACPRCDGVIMQSESRVVRPLVQELATAFYYPFRLVTLLASIGVVIVAGAAGFIPIVGPVLGAGIRFGYLFAILRSSSDGHEDIEFDTADVRASFLEWISPAIRMFLVAFIAFVPALAAATLLQGTSPLWPGLLTVLGLLYLPAGIIAAAEANAWYAPLNPVPAVMLIARIPGAYFTGCGMLLLLYAISAGAIAAAMSIEVPFVGMVLASLLGFLPLVAAARMLGILVYEKREEL